MLNIRVCICSDEGQKHTKGRDGHGYWYLLVLGIQTLQDSSGEEERGIDHRALHDDHTDGLQIEAGPTILNTRSPRVEMLSKEAVDG